MDIIDALSDGDLERIRMLVELLFDRDIRRPSSMDMFRSALRGDLERVRALIEQDPRLVRCQSDKVDGAAGLWSRR
eukprot:51181-Eustigmatos_ZCMA.PRE.1